MRRAIAYALLLLIALPVSAVVTLTALPLWNFVERRTGIESVGHSGPAGWCFCVTYTVFIAVVVALLLVRRGGRSTER
jgi:hypothetical protein